MTPDPRTVAAAEAALGNVADAWLSLPGVVAVEVARRRAGGLTADPADPADPPDADDVVIRVTVHPDAPVPDLPEELDGIRVEVIGGMPYEPE